MNKRFLLATLLGGLAMFVWTSLAHTVLPLGTAGIQEIPNETPTLAAMHSALGNAHGMYLFPGAGTGSRPSMPEYEQKLATNPSGILLYHPPGAKALAPSQLVTEFITELVEAFLALFLLSQTRLTGFGPRLGFIVTAGLLAALWTNLSYWNWYGFPTTYTAAYLFTQLIAFVCLGLVAGALMKQREPGRMAAA